MPEAVDFPKMEAEMLATWEREQTFEQSLSQRQGAKHFSFYDGPPFANGQPHFGHSLVQAIKDSVGRYRTMRGYYVERRNGWDCHGLPVEFAIEKQLGISGKKEILQLGIDKFNAACRDSVFLYQGEWEEFFRRIGRWTETDQAYATIDPTYTESVWWVLGQLHQRDLLYRGYKSMPYCPRCETPLSNFELNEGYRDDVADPSVYVTFPLADDPKTALVAWTTTPWTLPANAALAVKPEATYVTVEAGGRRLIVAKDRVSGLKLGDVRVVKNQTGAELVGLKYQPLYPLPDDVNAEQAERAHRVYASEAVSLDDGSGTLHVAPRYGEADLELGQRQNLPLIESVDASGHMVARLESVAGLFFKEADPVIIKELTDQARILAAETFTHTYPFCYRCETPLLYFAISTWFVKVTAIKEQLLKAAAEVGWTPAHIKNGRFGKWLEGARDWAISRNRYWGAPLPIWINQDDDRDYLVVTSRQQLKELSGASPEDLHRPMIDDVVIERDGHTYRRVEEVFDCWFESGSMPVAQHHYPFENEAVFQASFPADFVTEGLDQTRLWFYVLHVIASGLFEQPAYRSVLVNGMILAADGQKLSKRLQNYPPVEEVFADEGADALRLYLLGNDQAVGGDYMRFSRDDLRSTKRNLLLTLWNSYRFLATYADLSTAVSATEPASANPLDRWIISRTNQVIGQMTVAADNYQLAKAIRALSELIDDLSNWHIRRSRARLVGEDGGGRQAAIETLRFVLIKVTQLMAPWAPFVSDKLYRDLGGGRSVHLSDWPEAGKVDQALLDQMVQLRQLATEGHAQRSAAQIKVRQPLGEAEVTIPDRLDPALTDLLADELNVKKIVQTAGESGKIELNTKITQDLKAQGLARDIIRQIQGERRRAGLVPGDQVALILSTADTNLEQVIQSHRAAIERQTHSKIEIKAGKSEGVPHRVDEAELYIDLTPDN